MDYLDQTEYNIIGTSDGIISFVLRKEVYKMILYHGSDMVIKKPLSQKGRADVDFGKGFYMTEDKKMAQKWACNKNISIVNVYEADLSLLNVKQLLADEEWLDYVVFYRTHEGKLPFDDTLYDVICGPTADDKLFVTLDMYSDGFLSKQQAIHIINCMNYSCQVVFKNDAAMENAVRFKEAKELKGLERQNIYLQMTEDRKLASKKAIELIRKNNGR